MLKHWLVSRDLKGIIGGRFDKVYVEGTVINCKYKETKQQQMQYIRAKYQLGIKEQEKTIDKSKLKVNNNLLPSAMTYGGTNEQVR